MESEVVNLSFWLKEYLQAVTHWRGNGLVGSINTTSYCEEVPAFRPLSEYTKVNTR